MGNPMKIHGIARSVAPEIPACRLERLDFREDIFDRKSVFMSRGGTLTFPFPKAVCVETKAVGHVSG
jgi:hypothetical protein